MDPLGVADKVVDFTTLKRWSHSSPPEYKLDSALQEESSGDEKLATPPFVFREDLNEKIVLWSGQIHQLNCNAIVNSTNESLSERSNETREIYRTAGPQLISEIKHSVKVCRTGDAKLTKAYGLPCRHIVHTVGPRYNVKYRTAAESALYSAYRIVLQIALENKLTSLAFCAINSMRRNYPVDDGTNLALRTIRRFLESYGEQIDVIIFCMDATDMTSYTSLLPLYFPRDEDEAEYSRRHFQGRDIGAPITGEPIVNDRKIRIADNLHGGDDSDADHDGGGSDSVNDILSGGQEYDLGELADALGLSTTIGQTAFAKMEEDVDVAKQQRPKSVRLDEAALSEERERRYERIIRRARLEDFSDVTLRRCIFTGGDDRYGRTVIFIIGNHLPSSNAQLDRLLLYTFHMLDNVVKSPYIITYFHTSPTHDNHPEISYLRTLFSLCSDKYIRNLGALYIVHPTLWSKVLFWYNIRFHLRDIRDKTISLPGLEQLYARLGPPQLFDVPTFIRQYDLQVNGSNYYAVPVETASEL